jgi:hypothetical protein
MTVVGVVGMDTTFLPAPLRFSVLAPGARTALTRVDPAELYFTDKAIVLGITSGGNGVDIRTTKAHPAGKVQTRLGTIVSAAL